MQDVWPVFQQRYGMLPAIHARYINDGWAVDASEVAACQANGVRLVLVDNAVTVAGVTAGSEADGAAAAKRAVATMAALGIDSTLVVADIEPDQPLSAGWATGWCRGLLGAHVPGGFYGATNRATFCTPYSAVAHAGVPRLHRLVWTPYPQVGETSPNSPPHWAPDTCPADPTAVVGWQYAVNAMGGLVDQSVWTEEAYGLLWPRPAMARMMVSRACGLKRQPAHGGRNLAMIPAGGQILDTGKRQGTWALVQYRDQAGWITAALIVPL